MDNSVSLGALHGIFYAITPSVPWLMALKRYMKDGPQKGAVAFAGTLFGHLTLLWLSFCGWKEVVWLWFYFEPLLMVVGWIAIFVTVEELANLSTKVGYSPPKNIRTRREGFRYFALGMAWVFCNPGTLGGTTLLFNEVPNNGTVYLLTFLILSVLTFALVWAGILSPAWGLGVTQIKLGFTQADFHHSQSKPLYRPLAIVLVGGLLLEYATWVDEPHLLYHFDNLIGYTPFEQLTYSYSRDMVWQTDIEKEEKSLIVFDSDEKEQSELLTEAEKNIADRIASGELEAYVPIPEPGQDTDEEKAEGTEDEEDEFEEVDDDDIIDLVSEDEEEEDLGDFYQTNFDWNEGATEEGSPLPPLEHSPWDAEVSYKEFNERIERELPEHDELMELSVYEFNDMNQMIVYTRLHLLRLFLFPHWDKTDYLSQLAQMRSELDNKIEEQSTKVQQLVLPDDKGYELDILFDEPKDLSWPARRRLWALANLNGDLTEDTYEQLHQGYHGGLEENISLAKLQRLPKEVRFPWDFPRVEKRELPTVSRKKVVAEKGVEGLEVVNTELTNSYVRFLDPIALNNRLRSNDPDSFSIGEVKQSEEEGAEISAEQFDLWVRDAYQRAWSFEKTRKYPNLFPVPRPEEEFWPKKAPTESVKK